MSNQTIPANVNHNMYDPKKLDLDNLTVKDFVMGEDYLVSVKAPYFFDDEGVLFVSMETEKFAGDYYGDYAGGEDPFIVKELVQWAKKHNLVWEWDSPGAIRLIK